MGGGTDLYSALCVSEVSEPACGEEKGGLGITMQIIGFPFVLFFFGGGMANGYLLHFSNAMFTLHL